MMWFQTCIRLTIDLRSNAFYGPIPSSFLKAKLLFLSKNNFSCFAPLPYSNNFSASVSNSLPPQVIVATSILDISDNCLSGMLPDWFWSHLLVLGSLSLANNNLSGTLPSAIGFTSHIFVLSLSSNNFSGPLPLWLKNCTELRILDSSGNGFSGFMPSWIGKNLKKLVVLSLESNKLIGTLPATLYHLHSLQILDLSHNKLSGNIPSCVHRFIAMARDVNSSIEVLVLFKDYEARIPVEKAYFYYAFLNWKGMDRQFQKNLPLVKLISLANNNLRGEIPTGLTSLLGLKSLDLSSNSLHGRIPEQIGQLKFLEVLNLSYNKLHGEIPSSLSDVSSLAGMNLSHNNLSGRIPTGTQLQDFDSSTYAGNSELCGLPLSKTCPGDGDDSVQVLEPSDGDDSDMQCFYAGLGTGFAFGFLGILGTLTIIRRWRYAVFQLGGHLADWILVDVAISSSKISRRLRFK